MVHHAGCRLDSTHLVQLPGNVPVLLVHEGERVTHVTHSARSADAVHVVVDVGGKVVVDHLGSSSQ